MEEIRRRIGGTNEKTWVLQGTSEGHGGWRRVGGESVEPMQRQGGVKGGLMIMEGGEESVEPMEISQTLLCCLLITMI